MKIIKIEINPSNHAFGPLSEIYVTSQQRHRIKIWKSV